LIFDKFESNIFNGNSLGMPIIGTEKNLKSFTQKDLKDFVKENYTLGRFFIVASGNIEHKKLVEFAKKYLLKINRAGKNNMRSLDIQPSHDLYAPKETQQVHYILGAPTYGYKDTRRISVAVLSHILGEGSSSRLFQKIREENGIAYQINTFLNSFFDISTFGVYLSTNDKTVHKAEKLILSELEKIKSRKVNEIELDRAKEYLVGNMLMSLEGTTNRMIRMAHQMIYFNKIIPVEETVRKIHAVTSKEIRDLSNQLLGTKNSFNNGLIKVILSSKNFLLHKGA